MNPWLSSYALALGAVLLLWLGVSAYVVITRTLYDFRDLSFHGARRILERRLRELPTEDPETIRRLLRRFPRRTLAGIASDASTPDWIARSAARRLLARKVDRTLQRAESHRSEAQKWRRIAALRIVSAADEPDALLLIERALADPDPDVVGAAASILGDRSDRAAADLLVAALRAGRYSRSRIATSIEAFAQPISDLLLPLLDDFDAEVRAWAVTLLARYRDRPGLALEIAPLAADPDPSVRAAALKTLMAVGGRAARAVALELLGDPVWYVRAHAARALGRLDHGEHAARMVPLLADQNWWVRAAAKESFVELGAGATIVLEEALSSPDRFVQNGVAEVLQNTGVVDRLVARAAAEPGDELAERELRRIFAAGGRIIAEAALRRARPDDADRIGHLLDELPETRTA